MSCLDPNQASEFLDGVLGEGAAAAVEAHLADCGACRELLAVMVSSGVSPALGAPDPLTEPGSWPSAAAARLEPGTEVGRFIIEERIGHGGMGIVYRARDPELGRAVAIKLVRFEAGEERAAEARARLVREARAMARLSHPNVVTVYEAGTFGDQVFIAMELLDGESLGEHCARTGDPGEVVALFAAAGRGLAAAHEVGLVHRDFKPKNVIVTGGRAVVLDFGLVAGHATEADNHASVPAPGALAAGNLTADGAVPGTPAYMAPETFRGEAATAGADQYSFAVSLYQALSGSLPFSGTSVAELREQVLFARPDPLPARVPARVRRAVLRGLARDPADRFPSMLALVAELEPPERRPWLWIGASMVAAGAAVVLALAGGERVDHCAGAAERIAAAWNAEARAEVENRFAALEVPYAARTARAVVAALDDYATRWARIHRQTCEAGRRGELGDAAMTAQMACLDRRLRELDALGRLLQQGDRDVVSAAEDAASALSNLDSCTDQTRLAALAPPPTDPEKREALAAVTDELAEVKALLDVGRYPDALARARAQEQATVALDHPVARAELHHWLGRALEASGRYAAAEEALNESVFAALAAGDDRRLVLSSTALVRVAGARGANFSRGELWHRIAGGALARLDAPELSRGLDAAQVSLLAARGRFAEAEEIGEEVLAALEAGGGERDLEIAAAHRALGSLCTDQYRFDCGAEHHGRALAIYTAHYGEHHPAVAGALTDLGKAAAGAGQFEEALDHHRRAAAIREDALGKDHPDLARSYHNLSYPLIATGELDEAERACRRALAIFGRSLGADHPKNAPTLYHLGYLHWVKGEYEAAYEAHTQALAIQADAFGDDHPHVADIHIELGRTRRAQERYREAADEWERALSIRREHLGASDERTIYTMTDLAEMHLLLGEVHTALPLLEEADRHWQNTEGGERRMRALNDYFLADALWRAGASRARARRLAERALEGSRAAGDEESIERVRRWLRAHAPP